MTNVQVAEFKADVNHFKDEIAVSDVEETELYILPFLKAKDTIVNEDPNIKAYVEKYVAAANKAKAAPGYDEKKDERPVSKIVDKSLEDFRNGNIESYQSTSFEELQRHDLGLVSTCYMGLGFVVIGTLLVFLVKKIPEKSSSDDDSLDLGPTFARLRTNPRYVFGVLSQMFYVGAQIMVWTFIIQYAEKELDIGNATAAKHQIAALVIFLVFRFVCTYFLKFVSPGKLLAVLAVGGMATTLGAIYLEGMPGLYSLMAISACMSLMFPTIYGIALEGIGEDAKLGSAGLDPRDCWSRLADRFPRRNPRSRFVHGNHGNSRFVLLELLLLCVHCGLRHHVPQPKENNGRCLIAEIESIV